MNKYLLRFILAFAALSVTGLTKAESPPQSATLYENVRVYDGSSEKLSAPSNVLVVGNLIKAISIKPIDIPQGVIAARINGGGRTLMPGLIDAHAHLYLGVPQAFLFNPNLTFDEFDAKARESAKATLMSGFTTVRDMAGPTFKIKNEIDQGKTIGPRIYPSGTMITQTSGHGDFSEPEALPRSFGGPLSVGEKYRVTTLADGRDQVLTAVRFNLRNGASQIKIATGGGVSSPSDPVLLQQYTTDEIKAAVQAASDYGTYVATHAYNPISVRRAVDAGVKSIEHGQLLDEATVKYLKDKDVWLSIQVFDEYHGDNYTPLQISKEHQVVAGESDVFKWATKYGLKMAWGSDFFFEPDGKNQNLQLSKLQIYMSPARALRMSTSDSGKLMALSGARNPYPARLGVIEPEAYADLLLVDGDPTVDLNIIADPEKNFRIIMKDGKIYKNTL
jgi:imidazolonepropionase-like amidohydrolase